MDNSFEAVHHLLGVGRSRQAREILQSHLQRTPGDPDAHYLLACAAVQDGDTAGAEEQLQSALARDPRHFGARRLLFLLRLDARAYVEAEGIITALIRDHPAAAELFAFYARLMLFTFHLPKARALLEEARRLDPDDTEASLVSVLVATVTGDRSLANETLAELVRDNPEAGRVAHTLFYVLVTQRRHREALEVGQQLLRNEPDDEDLLEAVVDVRMQTHWASWPVYPFVRWGWAGVAGAWVVGVFGTRRLLGYSRTAAAVFLVGYLALVCYSWIYGPILRRWLRARGV